MKTHTLYALHTVSTTQLGWKCLEMFLQVGNDVSFIYLSKSYQLTSAIRLIASLSLHISQIK